MSFIDKITNSTGSKNTIIVFAGSLISAVLAFCGNTIAARVLGPTEYGILSSVIVFMLMFIQLSDFGTGKTVVRMASSVEETGIERKTIYSFALMFRGIFSFFLALVVIIFSNILNKYYFGNIDVSYIKLLAIGILFGGLGQTLVSMIQEMEQYRRLSVNKALVAATKLILIVSVYFCNAFSVRNIILITILSSIVGVYHAFRIISERITLRISLTDISKIVSYLKWVTLVQITSIFMMNAPAMILTKYSIPSEVGYYYAAANISFAFSMISESIFIVLLPKISKEADPKKILITCEAITKKMSIFIPISVVIILVSNFLIVTLYGKSYISSGVVLKILVFAALIDLITVAYLAALYRVQKIYYATADSLIRLVLYFSFGILLVGHLGAAGVAYAALINSLFSGFFRYFYVRKNLKEMA